MCSIDCVFDRFFFFQAEDGIRDLVRSRGLGDVYKRQGHGLLAPGRLSGVDGDRAGPDEAGHPFGRARIQDCLLYTSDAADERSSVDLGGRRFIKKKNERKKKNKKHKRKKMPEHLNHVIKCVNAL